VSYIHTASTVAAAAFFLHFYLYFLFVASSFRLLFSSDSVFVKLEVN